MKYVFLYRLSQNPKEHTQILTSVFLLCSEMEFPPVWEFVDADGVDTFAFRQSDGVAAGLEVVVAFKDKIAGDFRFVTGGNQMLSVQFKAEKIFGPKFAGETKKPQRKFIFPFSISPLRPPQSESD
jgi:hypothetical protein